jgi:hypothetical protein
MKILGKTLNGTRQKAAIVVFFTTLLTLAATPFLIASNVNQVLPTSEEISSAVTRLSEIEAIPNGTDVELDTELAAEIAEAKSLLGAAQTAISAEAAAQADVETAETALAAANSLTFDEATYDSAIDSAVANKQSAIDALVDAAGASLNAAEAVKTQAENCLSGSGKITINFFGSREVDCNNSTYGSLIKSAAQAVLDSALSDISTYQERLNPDNPNYIGNTVDAALTSAINDARANKQKAIDDFDGLKQSAVGLAESNLAAADEALTAASGNKTQALAAAISAIAQIADDSLYDRVNLAVYNGQLITLGPATAGYEYLSQTATKDNQADIEFQEPFGPDEYTSRTLKLNPDDRAWLASAHFDASGLAAGSYNFIVNYLVGGIPYDVTYEVVVPSLLNQEFDYQLARLKAADLGDLATVYETLWQGDTSVADAVKQIYPSQAGTVNDILSALNATKNLAYIGPIATAALSSLQSPLTQGQIINGVSVNLGAGQSLAIGGMSQIVDAAISGAGLDPSDITQAIDDTIEAGRLLADLAAAVQSLVSYVQDTDYNKLTGVQAINDYISAVAAKYASVNSALEAISQARADGNQVLGNNSYLKSIDELTAEVGVDFNAAVAGANQLLQRIAELSNSIADQAQGIGVDNLPDLKNYAVSQIEKAQQQLADWAKDNRDPIAAAIKQQAAQIAANQLDQLKNLVLGSQTYADLLDLVGEIKHVGQTVESIIQTALGDYQTVEPLVREAIELARYLSGDFKTQLQNVNSTADAVELIRQLAERYVKLDAQFANLSDLSDGAKTVANWVLRLANDTLTASLPHVEKALIRQIELRGQFDPEKFFEFSGGDSLSLSVDQPNLTVEVGYSQALLDVVDQINQILDELQLDLPEITLPTLSLTPKGLSPLLKFTYPTLSTTVVFPQLTDDIVLSNQVFEVVIAPSRLADALERFGVNLGTKTYQTVEILMPRCQIDGKSSLNAFSVDCKADDNSGGGTTGNGGSGGGGSSAPAGLTEGNITPTQTYRGLTADADDSSTLTTTPRTNTPAASEPQGEFVSIPIKRADWSLLSVGLTVLVLVISIIKLIGLRDHFTDKSNSIFRILTLVPTTAAIVVLIMLNDFATPMALVNVNTLPIAGVLIIQIALAVKSPHSEED